MNEFNYMSAALELFAAVVTAVLLTGCLIEDMICAELKLEGSLYGACIHRRLCWWLMRQSGYISHFQVQPILYG